MKVKQAAKFTAVLALTAVALASLLLVLSSQSAGAQAGGVIFVDKQLGRASPVVHVGEYLTFTILIRNDTPFTVTTLPLSDTYNTAVLGYADALPPPDSVDTGAGRLDWADLTTTFGDLAPGRQILVVVGFIAEHPAPAVVNRAEVHDALGASGTLSDTTSVITDTESVGGSSPVDKELQPGLIPQAGLPLTFTIVITNDGFTTMTIAPLVDIYDPTLLQFSYAVPPPDLVDAARGVLTWTDVTLWTGDIPAHGSVAVTAVFTALSAAANTTNRAEVSAASDWYGNDLGGGGDDVPIIIIDAPTPTPAPTATPIPVPTATPFPTPIPTMAPTNTPVPVVPTPVPATAVPAPTAIPMPTATVIATPLFLPESGWTGRTLEGGLLLGVALVAVMGGVALLLVRRTKGA
jgi:hypothetical protein